MYEENSTMNSRALDENLLAYLAGVYESNGGVFLQPQGSIVLYINGHHDFLLALKNIIKIDSAIISTPNYRLQIYGDLACEFLKKLYPYLISTRNQARLLFEYREHIKARKGSRIDLKEKNYRLEAARKIKSSRFKNDIDMSQVDEWIANYFMGLFDSKAKLNIKKKDDEYWINISLNLQNEGLALFLQQIYDTGYLYQARSSFKWDLNYDEAYNLLMNINPYLIGKRKYSEICMKFHRCFQEAQKPLKDEEIQFIEGLRDDLKNLKKLNVSKEYKTSKGSKKVISLMFCEDLAKSMDQIIVESGNNLNYNSIIKNAIKYMKLNEYKLLNFESKICENKLKTHQLSLVLENDLVEFINQQSPNRSEFIRNVVEIYLEDIQLLDNVN
ncbi:hypothetical protein DSECCO2_349630 [anaerobic digester metagenome]